MVALVSDDIYKELMSIELVFLVTLNRFIKLWQANKRKQ